MATYKCQLECILEKDKIFVFMKIEKLRGNKYPNLILTGKMKVKVCIELLKFITI